MQAFLAILPFLVLGASSETDGCADTTSLLQRSVNRHDGQNEPKNCPENCKMGPWGDWSHCSLTCGDKGTKTRSRGIAEPAKFGGNCTEPTQDTVPCGLPPCPTDCKVGPWDDWSPNCPKCGEESQQRTRSIITAPDHGGEKCPGLELSRKCDIPDCPPPPCDWEDWGNWSPCPHSCGDKTGTQHRSRQAKPESHKECQGNKTQSKICKPPIPCPIDCVVSVWTEWSDCDATCDGGVQGRTRVIEVEPKYGGKECPDPLEDAPQPCNTQECPIPCEYGPWSDWTPCSQTCDPGNSPGTTSRSRSVTQEAKYGGEECQGKTENELPCGVKPCPVPCKWEWTAWGNCDVSCGGGTQTRKRFITQEPQHNGEECPKGPDPNGDDSQSCNTQPCPVPCEMGPWSDWSDCSVTCGDDGTRTRSRNVTQEAKYGGKKCEDETHGKETCEGPFGKHCPIDCVIDTWSEWGDCPVTCGGGRQTRKRGVLVEPQYGGEECPKPKIEPRDCNTQPCPVPCEYGDWTEWGPCSGTCHSDSVKNTHTRSRKVSQDAQHGGEDCDGEDEQEEECEVPLPCPVDCVVTQWTAWKPCSLTCDGGSQSRSRQIVTEDKNGGKECPKISDSQDCNTQKCPEDCCLTDWSEWSKCSATCDGGSKSRTRNITREEKYGGNCPPEWLKDTAACGDTPCNPNPEPTVSPGPTVKPFSVITVCGTVKSAEDNSGVPSATVEILDKKAESKSNGEFCIYDLNSEDVKIVSASKKKWVSGSTTLPQPLDGDTSIVVKENGDVDGVIVILSPVLPSPKDWRIILQWGMTPLDLDARTQFGADAGKCSVYYDNTDATCAANHITGVLDQDHCFYDKDKQHSCTKLASGTGGPSAVPKSETTTLTDVDPDKCGDNCKIVFHVSNYMSCLAWGNCPAGTPKADTGTLDKSQAAVKVIHGDKQVAFFQLDHGDGEIKYGPNAPWKKWGMTYKQEMEEWWVFYIDVQKSEVVQCKGVGDNGQILNCGM